MNNSSKPTSEHGTVMSYVAGFILSLIFTFIPYFLVVNKTLTGNALLAAILVIAVVQMAIQLLFFLHLGRGPKPLYNVVFLFATASTIIVVIGASIFIMHNLYRNMSPDEAILKQAQEENISQVGGKQTGACKELLNNHVITISGGAAIPSIIEANRCDTLSFINKDSQNYTLAFGNRDDSSSVSYGGDDTVEVDDGRPEIITLNEVGEFTFIDELNPGVTGLFLVAP